MTRKPRGKRDPIEQTIELALKPGEFIPDRASYAFIADLNEIAANIAKLRQSEPARAVKFYETFLAGCHEKADELDDSSGSFGEFVRQLFPAWIQSRQAAKSDRDETAARLLEWMDDDPYGFCYRLENEIATAFDKAGLAAFEKHVRARFDETATANPSPGESFREKPDRRRWTDILRTLYLEQKNLQAYIALAEETGLSAQDCHAVATLLAARRKFADALNWVERGIDLDDKARHGSLAGYDLAKLKLELLTKLGRAGEALEAAWAEYRKDPNKYTYDDLIRFAPKPERALWHEKAIEAAQDADLRAGIEILLETNELGRLTELIGRSHDDSLEGLGHYVTEPAAKKLEKTYSDMAARLWRAQGMRIVNAGKSKYYDAALHNFVQARRCFEKAGLIAEWEKTVNQVRATHHRKTGFMARFETIVAATKPATKPSFLERAKARWGRPARGERGGRS